MPWDILLIFFVLAVVVPWRGRLRMRKLLAMEQVSTTDRLVLYASTIAFQWVAAAIVAWRAWAHRYSLNDLGLITPNLFRTALVVLIGTGVIGSLQWMNLRRVGRLPVASRGFLQAVAERILPQTGIE